MFVMLSNLTVAGIYFAPVAWRTAMLARLPATIWCWLQSARRTAGLVSHRSCL